MSTASNGKSRIEARHLSAVRGARAGRLRPREPAEIKPSSTLRTVAGSHMHETIRAMLSALRQPAFTLFVGLLLTARALAADPAAQGDFPDNAPVATVKGR